MNNTANWQPGSVAAHEACATGRLGAIKHVNTVFAAPLEWLFGDPSSWWLGVGVGVVLGLGLGLGLG